MGVGDALSGRRAVFLDRDGVLNRAVIRSGRPHPPETVDELQIDPDAPAALEALRREGLALIVVTNQPDVARGRQTRARAEAINDALAAALPIDDVRVCWHDDADGCECRKPKPGLLLAGAAALDVDVARSFMVGDRWSDVLAGTRAGCRTILIGSGYGENSRGATPDAQVASLSAAAAWILDTVRRESA